ncbi:erythromycin esterase family protein [Haloarcula rubripromontorii]|uniref:erythromycin esterase family protein n=1 Tax=Haloarcula rubripromontorii TaxID=1705562 RepID=UPI00345BAF91
MKPTTDISRREFVTVASAVTASALAGCSGNTVETTESAIETTDRNTTGSSPTGDGATETSDLLRAIDNQAIPFDLTASSSGLDDIAARLAETPIVGIGESSHGVKEFKQIPRQLVQRLVGDHGYRLVAIEGTLGDFAPVNAYVTDGKGDLDTALSSLEFYFWQTDEIRRLFQWLREFNDGRPSADQAVVRGYDAQFYHINARAIRTYLDSVDPEYLAEIEDSLEPLTTRFQTTDPAAVATDSQMALLEDLKERLRTHKSRYVEQRSETEFRLMQRHVWTLGRGLRFVEKLAAEEYTQGKTIRDAAMADNVAWLREWTDSERAIVMGNANHTTRNVGDTSESGTRMGQHLTERFGSDYYSLGLLFGSGSFAVPANHKKTEFETFELGGPVAETLEATLAEASHPQFFIDFADVRERASIDRSAADTAKFQLTAPKVPERGAMALPEPPDELMDGVVFIREVSPAAFSGSA